MSRKICLLSHEEAKDWTERGTAPDCHSHRHIKKCDALDMAHLGDYSNYSEPIASFVGPHHIIMCAAWTWRKKVGQPMLGSTRRHAFGLATMQLVRGA